MLTNELGNEGDKPNTTKLEKSPIARSYSPISMQPAAASDKLTQLWRRRTKSYTGLTLKQREDGKWVFKGNDGQHSKPEPNALYIFATLQDGSIRVGRRDSYSHAALADYAEEVRYAGAVTFTEKQEILKWNNDSTTYLPPAKLAYQAGINELNKFEPTDFGFNTLKISDAEWESNTSNQSVPVTFAYKKVTEEKHSPIITTLSEDKVEKTQQSAKF